MKRIPSTKTLRASFLPMLEHDHPSDEANRLILQLRDTLIKWRDGVIVGSVCREQCNELLGMYGVEYLESENEKASCYYLNAGDNYNVTLIFQIKPKLNIQCSTWGDWVEAQEKRGNKFKGPSQLT